MTYNHVTDHIAIMRLISGTPSFVRMPGLDFVIAALGRAGLLRLVVAQTEPTSNQPQMAWIKPNSPSYSEEGDVHLWDKATAAYVNITTDPTQGPKLFGEYLVAAADVAISHSGTGLPTAAIGNDGDFYHRVDAPGGIFGPKVAGAWPTNPLPGSSDGRHEVSGADPGAALGIDGDWALRADSPGGLFFKVAGAWQLVPGSRSGIHTGTGVPSAALGEDSDVYLRDDSPGGVYIKSAGTWTLQPNSDGDGQIHRGTGVPAAALGDNFDLYVRDDTPFGIYHKDSGGTWQLIPNTTAAGSAAASETVAGVIEIATQAETDAATDDARALTPAKLAGIDPDSAMADALRNILNETNGNVMAFTDAARAAPAATVGDDGDMALVHNTAGTSFKVYSKVAGAWVETFDSATAAGAVAVDALMYGVSNVPTAAEGAEGDIAVRLNMVGVTDSDIFVSGPHDGTSFPAEGSGWTQLALDTGASSGLITYNIPAGATFVIIHLNSNGTRRGISWDAGVGGDFNNDVSGSQASGAGYRAYGFATDIIAKRTEGDGNRRILGVPTQVRTGSSGTGADPGYAIWYTTAALHSSMSGRQFDVTLP